MVPVNLKQKDFVKYLLLMCTASQIQSKPCIILSLTSPTLFWFSFFILKIELLLNKICLITSVLMVLDVCVCERESIHLYVYIHANTQAYKYT